MSDEIYFQWQNDVLRKTIYPLREMKLRDFLVFYEEIDVWKKYGHKTEADSDIKAEIQAFKDAQVRLWREALAADASFREYFLHELTDAGCRDRLRLTETDAVELGKINKLHATFATYFPKVRDPRSESYFISQRIYEWELHRKEVVYQIAECQRKMRNWASFPQFKRHYDLQAALLPKLQNITLRMADAELESLYALLSVSRKLENRRTQVTQERSTALKKKIDLARQAAILSTRLAPLEVREATISAELGRMKSPPDRAALEGHFLTPEAPAPAPGFGAPADVEAAARIGSIHTALQQAFRLSKTDGGKLLAVQNQAWVLKAYRKTVEQRIAVLESNLRNMPANWSHRAERQAERDLRVAALQAIDLELGKLEDFQGLMAQSGKTPAQLASLVQQKEKEQAGVATNVGQIKGLLKTIDEQILIQEAILDTPDQDKLTQFSSTQAVTVRDIARGKGEAYRASLMEKDHMQLLEMVVQRFVKEPERYPIWLQYMVIHFSGMRYSSAHGSWADPKDLLVSLGTSSVDQAFRKMDQYAVDALCEDKIRRYEPGGAEEKPGPEAHIPALAGTQDPRWKAKVAGHLTRLHSTSPYYRRKGLFDLLMDEQNYEVEILTDDQALKALEALKESLHLPDWMWTEIVRLTQLRTREVKDPGWEALTPEEQEDKESPRWAQFRQIMSKWQQENLTGWREEHAATDQLIVSRAVCNEVAEHIQHLRGNKPPGGLTAKPQWYLSLAGKGLSKNPDEIRPYLLKATLENLREGASILWLRFVPDFPNEWRIAHPMRVSDGQELLPSSLFSGRGEWRYQLESDTVKRTRSAVDANNQRFTEIQWLRWIHEATVVEVAETADGKVVLTFETALPYEDKRLSTIGIFKQDPSYATYSVGASTLNGAFSGFTPPGDIPFENLENMLDWNRILLRPVMDPPALQAWRAKYMQKPQP
jgi:hypothetical protein